MVSLGHSELIFTLMKVLNTMALGNATPKCTHNIDALVNSMKPA